MFKRRQIIINKRFQFRFAFFVSSWVFALSLFYPLVLEYVFDVIFRFVALDPNGPALELIRLTQNSVVHELIVLEVVFLATIFVLSIFLSHRIAGPLFKLNRALKFAAQGKTEDIRFREKDHFEELAVSYNELMASLRVRSEQVESAMAVLEKARQGDPAQAGAAIEQAIVVMKGSSSAAQKDSA